MKKDHLKYLFGGAVVAMVALFGWYYVQPGQLDSFAQCLEEEGATFYGAFWCPHCAEQKRLFGKSEDALPYIECSTPDGQRQTPVCQEAGIQSYPTWEFADGGRLTGVVQLEELAEKTGCQLPEDT